MSAERENSRPRLGIPLPPPPPPPPPKHVNISGKLAFALQDLSSPTSSSDSSQDRFISVETRPDWSPTADVDNELLVARNRIWDLENIEGPAHFSFYRHIEPLLQEGPTCGLVALSMAMSCSQSPMSVEELLSVAKSYGYTNHGEMFSVDNMALLARKVLMQTCQVEVLHDGLNQDKEYIIKRIAIGSILLIPYDADRNHSPCCRLGHKAHWAAVSGVVRSNTSCHLVARQGKSRHLGMWRYEDFQKSNENLVELDPEREDDGRVYVIPEGGVAVGLRGRAILLHGLGLDSETVVDNSSHSIYTIGNTCAVYNSDKHAQWQPQASCVNTRCLGLF